MKKIIIALFLMVVVLVTLSGCISRPDTDMFFICKSRPQGEKAFGWAYPSDFPKVGYNHFSENDGKFCLIYYNALEPAGCNIKIIGPNGKFYCETQTLLIQHGLYFYFDPIISVMVKNCGYGKYEAKLYRNSVFIRTLEFYIEK